MNFTQRRTQLFDKLLGIPRKVQASRRKIGIENVRDSRVHNGLNSQNNVGCTRQYNCWKRGGGGSTVFADCVEKLVVQ